MAAPMFRTIFISSINFSAKSLRFPKPGTVKLCMANVQMSRNMFTQLKGSNRERHSKTMVLLSAGLCSIVLYGMNLCHKFQVHAKEQIRPKINPSKMIRNPMDNSGLHLTLYQYTTCPFCCKVRAFLDYYGFNYDIIEVNSVWKTQLKWSSYNKVPVLCVEDVAPEGFLQLNESSVIISVLASFLENRTASLEKLHSYFPPLISEEKKKTKYEYPNKYFIMFGDNVPDRSPAELNEERKWRRWADDVMVHMISPNTYRTPREALASFQHFSDRGDWDQNFSTFERYCVIYVGATVMYLIGKMLKRKYKLKDEVRESLYDACNEWVHAVGKDRKFMGGNKPNLADLNVYGVLCSMEGCNAYEDMMNNSLIGSWFMNTKRMVDDHAGGHVLARQATN